MMKMTSHMKYHHKDNDHNDNDNEEKVEVLIRKLWTLDRKAWDSDPECIAIRHDLTYFGFVL